MFYGVILKLLTNAFLFIIMFFLCIALEMVNQLRIETIDYLFFIKTYKIPLNNLAEGKYIYKINEFITNYLCLYIFKIKYLTIMYGVMMSIIQ